jgi:hypothetical protein
VRPERVALEDHAHLPLVRRHERAPVGVDDDAIAHADASARGALETGQAPQRRRLAAARGAEQGDELAGSDRQIQSVQSGLAAVALGQSGYLDLSHADQCSLAGGRRIRNGYFLNCALMKSK